MAGLTEMTANTGQDRGPDLDRLPDFIEERDRNAAWFFVGRTIQVEYIERTCDLALRRFREGAALAGATVLIQGAPGAGKTALLKHLREKWAMADAEAAPAALYVDPSELGDPAAIMARIAEALDPAKGAEFRRTTTSGGEAKAGVLGVGVGGTWGTATAPPPPDFGALRMLFPAEAWTRPLCLMVDEVQGLTQHQAALLRPLHLAGDGLPIVPVLAGLASSQEALAKQGGISRLSTGAVHTLGRLDAGQAAEAVQRMLACFRIEAEDAEAARWAALLEHISDRWPQHLQNAMRALGGGLLQAGGVLSSVDEAAVLRHARAWRLESYRQRRSPEMRGAVILVGHLMAAVRDGGLHRHQIVDTIRARIHDRPEGSSARRLPKGISPEDFLEHLIHRGALQEGEDDRLVCPIPSFRSFLIGEAVRTMFNELGDFMLEGVDEHSATEHDIRLLDELAREPEALDPWADGHAE